MRILKSWWRKMAPFHRSGIIWLERERKWNLPRSHTVSRWDGRSHVLLGVLDWDFPLCLWHTCLPIGKQIWTRVYFFFDENVKGSLLFSCSVTSDSLRPHGLKHARLPCPSPTPRACSNVCPLGQWCHPTISSSVVSFSFCIQSFPASRSFLMNHLFASGSQSIGVSASTSVLPMNTQDWSLGWIGWISLQSKGLSRVFSNTTVQKYQLWCLAFFTV